MPARPGPPDGPPADEPLGLELTRTAKALTRRFDDALAEGGGSLPTWLVLVSIMGGRHETQRQLADAVGIEGPTLTHHLTKLEEAGLVARTRDPANRRVQRVTMTDAGRAQFFALRDLVAAWDEQLRAGFSERELTQLRRYLARLRTNAESPTESPTGSPTGSPTD